MRVLPTKITPTKYSSLFAVRPEGNPSIFLSRRS